MLTLSQSVGYAVKALSCMQQGHGDSPRFVRDIAACCDVPAAYLAKVFKRLVDHGILETKRGWSGGTRLARPAASITLHEIASALDGPGFLDGCLLGHERCTDERACPTHQFWKLERARIAETLRTTTLASVIEFETARTTGARAPQTLAAVTR